MCRRSKEILTVDLETMDQTKWPAPSKCWKKREKQKLLMQSSLVSDYILQNENEEKGILR